jgi:hypothetical protein
MRVMRNMQGACCGVQNGALATPWDLDTEELSRSKNKNLQQET